MSPLLQIAQAVEVRIDWLGREAVDVGVINVIAAHRPQSWLAIDDPDMIYMSHICVCYKPVKSIMPN
jgi:hypothetical protein